MLGKRSEMRKWALKTSFKPANRAKDSPRYADQSNVMTYYICWSSQWQQGQLSPKLCTFTSIRNVMMLLKYPGIRAYAINACILLCILLCPIYSDAQTVPTRRYTSRDGLIADRITVITQDEKGFMWIGSLFGLSKYDGKKFTTIQLPPSQKK